MYVGLVDYDLNDKSKYPNLELMKISSYFKKDKNIVELYKDLRLSDKYTKIYLRKDKQDLNFPYLFLSQYRDKVTAGGYAYSNGVYVPLDAEIENSNPDFGLYSSFLRKYPKLKQVLVDSFVIRLQTTDEIKYSHEGKIYIYDSKPLLYRDKFDELLQIAKKNNKKIHFKEQIYSDTKKDFAFFCKSNDFSEESIFCCNEYFTDEELKELFPFCKTKYSVFVPFFNDDIFLKLDINQLLTVLLSDNYFKRFKIFLENSHLCCRDNAPLYNIIIMSRASDKKKFLEDAKKHKMLYSLANKLYEASRRAKKWKT